MVRPGMVRPASNPDRWKWLRRIAGWALFVVFIRFLYFKNFYADRPQILAWLTVHLVIQTAALYYAFAYFIFPRTLYHFRWGQLLLWLVVWQVAIYEYNYGLFLSLTQLDHGARLERDWQRLQEAGVFGFITSGWASFWSFFYSFPFAIMILTIRAIKDIIRLRTQNLELEKDKINLELNFLKAQVNPHFLFNTLNSVYARVFDTDEQAADLILRLSELMRYNLYETDLPRIALEKELAYIQNYLNLERNRLAEPYVVIDYEQTGEAQPYQIAPLLLIAFVENAFKHGIKGAGQAAYVQVRVIIGEDGQLVFAVENSVPPRRTVGNSVKKAGGIGLVNVQKRLEALYQGQYELTVTPGEEIYTIALTIQLESLPGSDSVGRTN